MISSLTTTAMNVGTQIFKNMIEIMGNKTMHTGLPCIELFSGLNRPWTLYTDEKFCQNYIGIQNNSMNCKI